MFEVTANDVSERLKDQVGSGKAVRLRGRLYKKPSGKAKRKVPTSMPLEILEILN